MGGRREQRWTERPARRAIKNAFVVLSTNYSCVVVEEGFVTFPVPEGRNGAKKLPFATKVTGVRPMLTTLPEGSLFLVLLGYYRHLK